MHDQPSSTLCSHTCPGGCVQSESDLDLRRAEVERVAATAAKREAAILNFGTTLNMNEDLISGCNMANQIPSLETSDTLEQVESKVEHLRLVIVRAQVCVAAHLAQTCRPSLDPCPASAAR